MKLPKSISRVMKFVVKLITYVPRVCYRYWRYLHDNNVLPLVARVVPRSEWGAVPPRARVAQSTPVDHMVVSWTHTEPCDTYEACVRAVQEVQKDHMMQGADDIEFNFLAGGDGNLYEGRGWDTATAFAKTNRKAQALVGNCINLGLINQPTTEPTKMLEKTIASLFALAEDTYVRNLATIFRIALDNCEEIIFDN